MGNGKRRILKRRRDNVKQRYWVGKKLKNYGSSISRLLDNERRKEITQARIEGRARYLKTPMTAKELNEEIAYFNIKDLPIRVFYDPSHAKAEDLAEQELRKTINDVAIQRREAKKFFKEHGKFPYRTFGSIRGLTIPELSSKAKKVTDEGIDRLGTHPFLVTSKEKLLNIEKKKFVVPGHALTVLKSKASKERVLTSRLDDKFITISKNPHTMVGFESDTEEEAKQVHKRLEQEAEDRIK